MLELVDRTSLSFVDLYHRGSSPLSDNFLINKIFLVIPRKRGHSLIGKTAILHIVISGSSPDISIKF